MAQKLYVKSTDENGKTAMKEVHIIRSWQESSGTQIYLHANGVYGYKDGSPVRDVKEFTIIGDPVQRKAAAAWWNRAGKTISEDFYKRQEEMIETRTLADVPVIEGDVSDLDTALYSRRPVTDRSRNAFSEPTTWFDWFDKRPDWWGHAPLIEIGGFRYKMTEVPEDEPAPEPVKPEPAQETDENADGKPW